MANTDNLNLTEEQRQKLSQILGQPIPAPKAQPVKNMEPEQEPPQQAVEEAPFPASTYEAPSEEEDLQITADETEVEPQIQPDVENVPEVNTHPPSTWRFVIAGVIVVIFAVLAVIAFLKIYQQAGTLVPQY